MSLSQLCKTTISEEQLGKDMYSKHHTPTIHSKSHTNQTVNNFTSYEPKPKMYFKLIKPNFQYHANLMFTQP